MSKLSGVASKTIFQVARGETPITKYVATMIAQVLQLPETEFYDGYLHFISNSPGEKIKEIRKEKNLTQQELAYLVGCHPSSISEWENGHIVPLRRQYERLVELFS